MPNIPAIAEVRTLDALRNFVHLTLCSKENLLETQSPVKELALFRGDQVCGLQFFVRGPRQICLSAIWTAEPNVIFFYDTKGERYAKSQLEHSLPLPIATRDAA